MMRSGELFGLKWKNVKVYEKNDYKWAEIIVEGETSKVRKDRVFVARGGEYFERLKRLSKHTKGNDFVFTLNNGTHWHGKNRRALEHHFEKCIEWEWVLQMLKRGNLNYTVVGIMELVSE